MYQISSAVKAALLDGASEQDLRITFSDRTLSARNGDIEASGASFSHAFSASDDIMIGDTSAATFACSLFNANGALHGYSFGEAFVEIGVKVSNAWTYIPMGYFYIAKPTKTNVDIINVSDALDRMRFFERDAAQFLATITYPTSVNAILTALCSYVGITAEIQSFTDATVNDNPFPTSCSCRHILSWIAEKRFRCARINRSGKLEFYWLPASSVETVPADLISGDSLEIGEYQTQAITQTVIKNMGGLMYVNGSDSTNIFSVLGNPFMQEADTSLLTFAQSFPLYVPFSCDVIYANPALDCGDLITVTVPNGNTDTSHVIPLMQRELSWDGICHATYVATGNKIRPMENEIDYSINVSNSADGVIEKIKAKGIEADWVRAGTLQGVEIIAEEGSVGGWGISEDELSKTSLYDYSHSGLDTDAALMIIQYMRGQVTKEQVLARYPNADVNNDGNLDQADVDIIMGLDLGTIPESGNATARLSVNNPFSVIQAIVNGKTAFTAGIQGIYAEDVSVVTLKGVDSTTKRTGYELTSNSLNFVSGGTSPSRVIHNSGSSAHTKLATSTSTSWQSFTVQTPVKYSGFVLQCKANDGRVLASSYLFPEQWNDSATEPASATMDANANHCVYPGDTNYHAWCYLWHDTTNNIYKAYLSRSASAGTTVELWGME